MIKIENIIDVVVLWVDGDDPEWLREKNKYCQKKSGTENSINRFRDWNNMKYWFRAIEQYAPWVRMVHFVTYGHLPSFLNVECPKLHIVNHHDIIDDKYLPTFNSASIEINIHKIEGLAEQFIYFNDDMFLIDKVEKEDFFYKGLPCEEGLQGTITSVGDKSAYCHHMLNDIDIINRHFNKKKQIKMNFNKWYNYKYGLENIRNLCLAPWGNFVGFKNAHLPVSLLKSTFEEVWQNESDVLNETVSHKFREFNDVNQYVFRYWQLAKGNFYPRRCLGSRYEITEKNVSQIVQDILEKKYKAICLNDPDFEIDFDYCQSSLNEAFEKVLPNPSCFEKKG